MARPGGQLALARAAGAPWSSARGCRCRRPPWSPAGRRSSDRRHAGRGCCGMPKAAAPMRSPWRARRLRSRTVNCSTGSMPCWASMAAQAKADICALAPAPSVTLTASARPFRQPARASTAACAARIGRRGLRRHDEGAATQQGLQPAVGCGAHAGILRAFRFGGALRRCRPCRPAAVSRASSYSALQPLGGAGRLGLEIVAAGHRLGAAPFGEI